MFTTINISTKKHATQWLLGLVLCSSVPMINGCDKKLDINPKGTIDEQVLYTPTGAERLTIAAYSELGNDHYDKPFSLWPYGDVRSDDAYKGGRDESDIQNFHFIETFYNTRTDFGEWMRFGTRYISASQGPM